jgi:hypothetical protein
MVYETSPVEAVLPVTMFKNLTDYSCSSFKNVLRTQKQYQNTVAEEVHS